MTVNSTEQQAPLPVTPGKEALRQAEILRAGTVEVIPEEGLAVRIQQSLDANAPLRVKYGADPSAPDLHVGHVVPIRKLQQFQELGHQIVFLIGDFTAMIGDPSGKSETRPRLTSEQVEDNARTYFDQVFMFLDPDKTEVVRNNDWLGKLSLTEVIELAAKYTVARMLERDDFHKRFTSETPIYVHEFLYPLAQAYDSVAVQADVEIGGTDQKFNLLLGREIQREYNQAPQMVLTMPLLVGTDGTKKMSKSQGNYIGVSEPPREIFGKAMSIPDEQMADYLRLVLGHEDVSIQSLQEQVADDKLHPRDLKIKIASELVALFHDRTAAEAERDYFLQVFSKREMPDVDSMEQAQVALPDGENEVWVAKALVDAGFFPSNSKARKAIQQGSVRVDGDKLADEGAALPAGTYVLQNGKRSFKRVTIA